MKTLLSVLLTAVAVLGSSQSQAQDVFVYSGAGGSVAPPAVSQPGLAQAPMIYPPPPGYAPPMAYPPPLIVCAQPAYYPSPTVTYIGGPGSCAPNYYAGGQGACYGSPSVIYFGRLQAHREGYHFRHYR